MSFIEPTSNHGGLRTSPAPQAGGGIRPRGKSKKLTGYFVLRDELVGELMTEAEVFKGAHVKIMVGTGKSFGKILIKPVGEEASNARLRRQGKAVPGYLLESTLIPIPDEPLPLRRTPAAYELSTSGGEDEKALIVTLPWFGAVVPDLLPWED